MIYSILIISLIVLPVLIYFIVIGIIDYEYDKNIEKLGNKENTD